MILKDFQFLDNCIILKLKHGDMGGRDPISRQYKVNLGGNPHETLFE